ncbi:MAG: response regulator [Aggregatilineaceae bacterium]
MPAVLIVDDHQVVRRVVRHALQPLAFDVIEAEDGRSALALATSYGLDLVLVDTDLPDQDGFSLVQHLKALPHLAEVPVIILSSRGGVDDEIRALEVGAAGFLAEPFHTQALRQAVLCALGTG